MPANAERHLDGDVWFFRFEKTWLAVWPIQLGAPEVREPSGRAAQAMASARGLVAPKTGGPFYGFAMEVGDAESHGDFNAFRRAVRERSRLDISRLEEGVARLTGANDRFIELAFPRGGGMAGVNRNGAVRDFDDPAEWDLMRTVSGHPVVNLGWKEGVLRVNAGGYLFESSMNRQGETSFSERPVQP